MTHKTEDGLAKATAETLEVLSPASVPATVECYISKRSIAGADARLVKYDAKTEVWVHKRFLGEQVALDDDDDDELSAIEDELEAYAPEGDEPATEEAPVEV